MGESEEAALVTATGEVTVPSGVPAAWYPCPTRARQLRWWDGSGWTEHTLDPGADDAADDPEPDTLPPENAPVIPTAAAPPAPPRSAMVRRLPRPRDHTPDLGPLRSRSTFATVESPPAATVKSAPPTRRRLLAGGLLLVIAISIPFLMSVTAAMNDDPPYLRAPWPKASTAQLGVAERERLLSPEGMSAQILTDLRTDGSVVKDARCPFGAKAHDRDILTCRVDMESASADVRVQVTDGYPNVAFVIVGFDYD